MFLGADLPFLAILSLSLLMLRFASQSKSQIYSVEKTVMEKGPVSTPWTAGQVCRHFNRLHHCQGGQTVEHNSFESLIITQVDDMPEPWKVFHLRLSLLCLSLMCFLGPMYACNPEDFTPFLTAIFWMLGVGILVAFIYSFTSHFSTPGRTQEKN